MKEIKYLLNHHHESSKVLGTVKSVRKTKKGLKITFESDYFKSQSDFDKEMQNIHKALSE